MPLDRGKLEAFVGMFAGDLAATLHGATVVIGDKLGLYRALAAGGPQTAAHKGEERVRQAFAGDGAPILLAQAYPASAFSGFDSHADSIEAARKAAAGARVSDRVTFEVAAADTFPGSPYDLVCVFNALHEMGDPVAAARHIREALAPDGALLVVEPFAGDRVEDNLNVVGRIFYSTSTVVCVPNALAQGATAALGAQAGEEALRAA